MDKKHKFCLNVFCKTPNPSLRAKRSNPDSRRFSRIDGSSDLCHFPPPLAGLLRFARNDDVADVLA
jgi:hypothetical protein